MNDLIKAALEKVGFDTLEEWPNCTVPDCHWKCCMWSGTDYCFQHAAQSLGRKEMERRWEFTHGYPLTDSCNWPEGMK